MSASIEFNGIRIDFLPDLPKGVIVTQTREAITIHFPDGHNRRIPYREVKPLSPPETK